MRGEPPSGGRDAAPCGPRPWRGVGDAGSARASRRLACPGTSRAESTSWASPGPQPNSPGTARPLQPPRSARRRPTALAFCGSPWGLLGRRRLRFPRFLRGKQRHREGRSPMQGHTAKKWLRWDSNRGQSDFCSAFSFLVPGGSPEASPVSAGLGQASPDQGSFLPLPSAAPSCPSCLPADRQRDC